MVGAMRPREGPPEGTQNREHDPASNQGGPHDPKHCPASLKVSLTNYLSIDWRLSGPYCKTTPFSLEGGAPWSLLVNGESA